MNISFGTSSRADFNDPESVKKFPWKLFLFIGLGVPFIFMIFGGGMLYWDYYRTHSWNDAPAEVTFSELSSYRDRGNIMYTPDIRYTYKVDEKDYEGVVSIGSESWRSASAKIVATYPEGKSTTVKVNPKDPADSYLPIEDWFLPLLFLGFGAFLATIFGSVGIYGLRKQQQLQSGIPLSPKP